MVLQAATWQTPSSRPTGTGRHGTSRQHQALVVPTQGDGPSTSGRGCPADAHRSRSRRTSLSPAALKFSRGMQIPNTSIATASSSDRLLPAQPAPAGPSTPVAAVTDAALVQEQGGASLLQLVAAWDQLAPRLPPQAGGGHAADVILAALKLAVAYAPLAPMPAAAAASSSSSLQQEQQPGQQQQQQQQQQASSLSPPVARALSLASRLADLAAAGLPVDAESIAAGILAEVLLAGPGSSSSSSSRSGGSPPALTLAVVEERMGPIVAQLVHDVQRARQLPARVELLDDTAAAALRELCLAFYDVRATAVEVVARLDLLSSPAFAVLPGYEQQVCALEALQMYAPMGHALGLTGVAAQLEDHCFQVLFPESYERTAAWLREGAAANADLLEECKRQLVAAVEAHPRFGELAAGLQVFGRTKTLFSTLKKLLRLGNTAAGGRARTQLYDLMGLRAVVQPQPGVPAEVAEEAAAAACYLVHEAACGLWECVEGRSKDYIAAPKPNGYQSLHATMRMRSEASSLDEGAEEVGSLPTLELQIRTQAMHDRAEMGEAAHAAYKGGLDAHQALQLKAGTEAVLRRAAAAAAAMAGSTAAANSDAAAEALFRHLDQNGDGRISLEELQFTLQELGVREAQAQSRAATELLQLASADGAGDASSSGEEGEVEEDGTIGFEAFMAFQRKVGLVQAISAIDHQQAVALEGQQQGQGKEEEQAAASFLSSSSSSSSSSSDGELDRLIFTDVAGVPFGGGSRGRGRRMAAGAAPCLARSQRLQARSRDSQPQGWLGSGRWGHWSAVSSSSSRGGSVAAHAFVDVSSAYGSSGGGGGSIDSLDVEGGLPSSSAGAAAGPNRVNGSARNGAVPLWHTDHGPSSSSSSAPGAAGAGQPGQPLLVGKPRRAVAGAADSSPVAAAAEPVPDGALAVEEASSSSHEVSAVQRATLAMQGIVRLVSQPGPPPADATWQLLPAPSNPHRLLNAVGEALPPPPAEGSGSSGGVRAQAVRIPEQGPCIIGAVLDRDNDCVLDVPTVSGRHARLEVVRRRDARGGYSKLVITDLGSKNGTWVNSRRIGANKQVAVRPGDVIRLAEQIIAFEVQALPPAPPNPAVAASNGTLAAAAAAEHVVAAMPAVSSALRIAGALEAAAAAAGHFPPGGAVYADLADRARQLMTAGEHSQAYALLLAGTMQQPWAGGLWAQLANLERQRARRAERGASFAAARAFYAAAAACFAALTPAGAGGALRAAAERAEGLARVYSGWAQQEMGLGHAGAARALFRAGVSAAREHPAGAAAAGAPRQLVAWAAREWKDGEASAAQRLCVEALEVEPGNAYALTLLGSIEAAARQTEAARRLFQHALETEPLHTPALQAWARLEASTGSFSLARDLFSQAQRQQPLSTHVLQAWAVAEARRGDADKARSLFQRCTKLDPSCRAAWHAWGKLEDGAGRTDVARRLYQAVLHLDPRSVPALSALGCLERRAGDLAAAEARLEEALVVDSDHAPSVYELALVREAQGRTNEAAKLKRKAQRLNAVRRSSLDEVAAVKLSGSAAPRGTAVKTA